MTAKCVSCGKYLENSDDIWQVIQITGDGWRIKAAACSELCAREAQRVNAIIHRSRLNEIECQGFQRMTLQTFLGEQTKSLPVWKEEPRP